MRSIYNQPDKPMFPDDAPTRQTMSPEELQDIIRNRGILGPRRPLGGVGGTPSFGNDLQMMPMPEGNLSGDYQAIPTDSAVPVAMPPMASMPQSPMPGMEADGASLAGGLWRLPSALGGVKAGMGGVKRKSLTPALAQMLLAQLRGQ